MKNSLIKTLIAAGLLFGQTPDQFKQAKEAIKSGGMSGAQAKGSAKAQGYTDQQIETAVQKEKDSKPESKETDEQKEKDPKSELEKPATEMGVIDASAPPVTIISASPYCIILNASPIAWVAVAQAETNP